MEVEAPEALSGPDDVGDVVQDEGADGQIGDVLIRAGVPGSLAGAGVMDGPRPSDRTRSLVAA